MARSEHGQAQCGAIEAFTARSVARKVRLMNRSGPLPAASRLDIHLFPHDFQTRIITRPAERKNI